MLKQTGGWVLLAFQRFNQYDLFKGRLTTLRKQYGWTQEEAANRLEIPRSTYAGYEKCIREAGYEMLVKIATQFDVSIDYLLGISEYPNSKKNAHHFLTQGGLHWNGIPLEEAELLPIRQLLENLIEMRAKMDRSQ